MDIRTLLKRCAYDVYIVATEGDSTEISATSRRSGDVLSHICDPSVVQEASLKIQERSKLTPVTPGCSSSAILPRTTSHIWITDSNRLLLLRSSVGNVTKGRYARTNHAGGGGSG